MKRTNSYRFSVLFGLFALLVAVAAPAVAGSSSVQVVEYQAAAGVVHVSVHNSGSSAATAVVFADVVLVGGVPASASQSVTVAAGETLGVTLGFGAAVSGVIQVGAVDESNPF